MTSGDTPSNTRPLHRRRVVDYWLMRCRGAAVMIGGPDTASEQAGEELEPWIPWTLTASGNVDVQEHGDGCVGGEYLPPESSAVVAVVDDVDADKVEAALFKSAKRINEAIDSGDVDELQKAISKSSSEVSGAITA